MQDFAKENQLLKGYISSLQKENEARNIERSTLFHEIERMGAEIDRLNSIISKHNSKNTNHSNQAERQMKTLKESNANLLKEMQIIKSKNTQISSQLKTKQSSILTLSQEKQSLISQVMILKELEFQLTGQKKKAISLEAQINNYKAKIIQISNYQARNSSLNLRITQLQSKLKIVEDNYKRQIFTFEERVNKMQLENEDLRANNRASIQISNLLNSKINLQATVKRLNSKIQWLQSNNHQKQSQGLEIKVRDLQAALSQAQNHIEHLKSNELQYQSLQAIKNGKQEQILTLECGIESLKADKIHLEKELRDKEQIISNLEEEVYNLTNLNQRNHQSQTQNHELNFIKTQLQKQISLLTQANMTLREQSNKLIQKQTNYISEVTSLRQERERLLKELDNQSFSLDQAQNQIKLYKSKVTQYHINRNESHYRNPERDHHHHRQNDDGNLRLIVSRLQQQIQQLKSSQFKSQLFQDNVHNNYESLNAKSQISQMSRQTRSPTAGISINLGGEKNDNNKRKWQNLQRKINVLRNENQTLKKTLFD